MEPIRYCLLKGKDSCLDHRKSIREHGCCWWTQSHGLRVGDICYLYIADDYSKSIRYKLEVVDAACKREDQDCWRRGFRDKGTCAKLVPVAEYYGGDELTMDRLEGLGISKFTIFSFLDENQVAAIDKCFTHPFDIHKAGITKYDDPKSCRDALYKFLKGLTQDDGHAAFCGIFLDKAVFTVTASLSATYNPDQKVEWYFHKYVIVSYTEGEEPFISHFDDGEFWDENGCTNIEDLCQYMWADIVGSLYRYEFPDELNDYFLI